jgi:hypothetical protein
MKPTRRKIKAAIRKADLVSMNDMEMKIISYHVADKAKSVLTIQSRAASDRMTFGYTWDDLLDGELSENGMELVARGQTLRFYQLTPILLN